MAGKVKEVFRLAEEIGRDIRSFEEVPRLMSLAYELALSEPRTAHGRILKAERLSQARGRHGRTWIAEPGGLWMALSLYDDHLPQTHGLFPLIFGLAMARMALDLGLPARIRWINDLHFRGRKLAGVLIEKHAEWLIVGLGINVNNPPPPGMPAETLSRLAGKYISLDEIFHLVIHHLRYYYALFRDLEAELSPYEEVPENKLVKDFRKYSDTLGRCVAWAGNLDREEPLIAHTRDILPNGSLLLETKEGSFPVNFGEIIYI